MMRLNNFLHTLANYYKYGIVSITCIVLLSSGTNPATATPKDVYGGDVYTASDINQVKKELDSLYAIDAVLAKEIEIKKYKKQLSESMLSVHKNKRK